MIVEGDILYPPVQALQTLAKFQKLDAGDIVLTGTPVGTALTARGISQKRVSSTCRRFCPRKPKPNYLHHGDVVEATVATDDGAINLGTQHNKVVYA